MLSRGAKKCLDLMRWYAARYKDVFPYQATIAARLGKSEQQLRRYFLELKNAGMIEIHKQGRNPASYQLLTQENERSVSGRRAVDERSNERSKPPHLFTELNNVLDKTDQSTENATDSYGQAQAGTLRRHLRAAGFEHLTERIAAEAQSRQVSLFLVASRIERAFRCASRKLSTKPRTDGWIWRVSGLAAESEAHASEDLSNRKHLTEPRLFGEQRPESFDGTATDDLRASAARFDSGRDASTIDDAEPAEAPDGELQNHAELEHKSLPIVSPESYKSGSIGAASGAQGHGVQREAATGNAWPFETPCIPLAVEDRVSVSGEVAMTLDPPKKPPAGDDWLRGFAANVHQLARAKVLTRRVL